MARVEADRHMRAPFVLRCWVMQLRQRIASRSVNVGLVRSMRFDQQLSFGRTFVNFLRAAKLTRVGSSCLLTQDEA